MIENKTSPHSKGAELFAAIIATVITIVVMGWGLIAIINVAVEHRANEERRVHEQLVSQCEAVNGTFSGNNITGMCSLDNGVVIDPSRIDQGKK